MYGKADGNAALALRLYQERYPQRQCPDRKTFVRLHYRLCEYGKFNSPGLGRGRPRSTTPEVQEEILEAVNITPSISTRRVALQVSVPHTTVWRLLKEYQLYPYHLQRVQALSPADYPARVRFCQWFLQQCGVNPNFPALVLFTDEAQFTRDGITNFHNQHVWAYENPRATVPSHHHVRFSLNMWADIIADRLVGPHVLVPISFLKHIIIKSIVFCKIKCEERRYSAERKRQNTVKDSNLPVRHLLRLSIQAQFAGSSRAVYIVPSD
ncbi:hypothetical protein ANN_18293 [Periplaneta americana]|uniref:DUF4817 domain-containing protein n=1 Tax=Periplaneta americana TaxID=6978 RepID=A0ABQ8SPP2_PERAM|nr:hypothetical protein ANN_18293 [Periplaneta americana]